MKMEVVVVYKGALAYYRIVKEKADVYSAYLKRYTGPQPPQNSITLARSIRHWTGSIDDHDLLTEIGNAIERHQQIDPLFPRTGDNRSVMDNLV